MNDVIEKGLRNSFNTLCSLEKKKREEAEGRQEERGGQDEVLSRLLLVHFFPSVLQGKNEMLSFPFLRG